MAYEGANHQLNNTILNLQNCYLTFVVHAQLTFRATVLVHTFLPNFKGKDRHFIGSSRKHAAYQSIDSWRIPYIKLIQHR